MSGRDPLDTLDQRARLERCVVEDLAKLVAAISTTLDGLESCFQLVRLTARRASSSLTELDAQLDRRGELGELLTAQELAAQVERDLLASGLERRKRAFERLCRHAAAIMTGRGNDPSRPAGEPCSLEDCARAGDLQVAVTGDEVEPARTIRVCVPHGRAVAYRNAAANVSKAAAAILEDEVATDDPGPAEVTS